MGAGAPLSRPRRRAGDTHTGVLVAGLMGGLDVVAAARRANAAAAEAVSRLGPARSPRRDEIDALISTESASSPA